MKKFIIAVPLLALVCFSLSGCMLAGFAVGEAAKGAMAYGRYAVL